MREGFEMAVTIRACCDAREDAVDVEEGGEPCVGGGAGRQNSDVVAADSDVCCEGTCEAVEREDEVWLFWCGDAKDVGREVDRGLDESHTRITLLREGVAGVGVDEEPFAVVGEAGRGDLPFCDGLTSAGLDRICIIASASVSTPRRTDRSRHTEHQSLQTRRHRRRRVCRRRGRDFRVHEEPSQKADPVQNVVDRRARSKRDASYPKRLARSVRAAKLLCQITASATPLPSRGERNRTIVPAHPALAITVL